MYIILRVYTATFLLILYKLYTYFMAKKGSKWILVGIKTRLFATRLSNSILDGWSHNLSQFSPDQSV